MGVGGIDGGMGHVGEASSIRTANTLKSIGSTAFNMAMNGATVAAGMFGGPAGSAAMSSLRGGAGGTIDQIAGTAANATQSNVGAAGDQMMQAQSQQMELFRLQMASNSMNESFNTLTNIAKNKHDTAMSAIQNTR
jgi:hypothetical protein